MAENKPRFENEIPDLIFTEPSKLGRKGFGGQCPLCGRLSPEDSKRLDDIQKSLDVMVVLLRQATQSGMAIP